MSSLDYNRYQFITNAIGQPHVNSVGTAPSSAIITAPSGNFQVVGFYGQSGVVQLAKRTRGSSSWSIVTGPNVASATTDAHNAVSCGVDENDIISIIYGEQHNAPMKMRRGSV